jgi:hypothetical protein
MDSLTDERNSWFNALRLEEAHDYSSATLYYVEDAGQCLSRGSFVRAAMSTSCAASCLATLGHTDYALKLYSAAASLYEHNGDLSVGKSLREALWSLLHAFEYFTLASDPISTERASKKYADLAQRVDRFEAQSVFDALKTRRESVLIARADLSSPPNGISAASIQNWSKLQRSLNAYLQQVQSVTLPETSPDELEDTQELEVEEEGLMYEEPEYLERRIVS